MGLIKNDRQLAFTRRTLGEIEAALKKLKTKHRGRALRLFSSGPLGMIEQLEGEVREYLWLKKATPARFLKRNPVVKLEAVGPYLARLRIASGLTQEDVARKASCKQPDIARLEDADYRAHSARTLKAVAGALGVEILIGARKVRSGRTG